MKKTVLTFLMILKISSLYASWQWDVLLPWPDLATDLLSREGTEKEKNPLLELCNTSDCVFRGLKIQTSVGEPKSAQVWQNHQSAIKDPSFCGKPTQSQLNLPARGKRHSAANKALGQWECPELRLKAQLKGAPRFMHSTFCSFDHDAEEGHTRCSVLETAN